MPPHTASACYFIINSKYSNENNHVFRKSSQDRFPFSLRSQASSLHSKSEDWPDPAHRSILNVNHNLKENKEDWREGESKLINVEMPVHSNQSQEKNEYSLLYNIILEL